MSAEKVILKKVQEVFSVQKSDKRLSSLSTITDSEGLLRVKTKVFMRKEIFRLRILLPSEHHFAKSLIIEKHNELGHSGVQMMLNTLREKYWILKGQ